MTTIGKGQNGTGGTIFGAGAGKQQGTTAVVIGRNACSAAASGNNIIALGTQAAQNAAGTNDGIFIGRTAGQAVGGSLGMICIGTGAGLNASGLNDIFIGSQFTGLAVKGTNNTIAIGSSAMANGDVTGNGNIAIGERAMSNNAFTTGSNNIALGVGALGTASGGASDNIAIGRDANPPAGESNYYSIGSFLTGYHDGGNKRFGVNVGDQDFALYGAFAVIRGDSLDDLTPVVHWEQGGVAVQNFFGAQDPNGVVTGNAGDLYFRADGANSTVYQRKTSGADTVWSDIGSGETTSVQATVSSNTTLVDPGTNHHIIPVDTSGGPVNVTLPSTPSANAKFTIKAGPDALTNPVTITGSIDGDVSKLLSVAYAALTLIFDSTNSVWISY